MASRLLRLTDAVTGRSDRVVGRAGALLDRLGGARWWVQVLVVWALTRAFSVVVVCVVARQQGASPWTPERPGYFDYIDGWDAGYYRQIFESGYPAVLPRSETGVVLPNRWAFLPVFPGLVRALSAVTGLPWSYAAPLVATLASLGLCLVLHRLFAERLGDPVALAAVGLFSVQAAAPVLGFGYAESLGLLLVAAALLCASRGRHLLAVPFVVVAALTRPTAAPLALALFLLLLVRVLTVRPFPVRENVRLAVLVLVSGLSVVVWPVVVGVRTGEADAYVATEAAWHGGESILPGQLWARVAIRLFGTVAGLGVLALVLLAMVAVLLTGPVRRVGLVMWLWTGSYLLYLIGVAVPNGSTFRFALGAFPLVLAAAGVSSSRPYRVALLLLGLVLQVVWVAWLWHWSGSGPFGALEANP